ncbi:LOW QUALITY PROTEIN: cadherin-12-like [Callospermophilus lateralis]
MDREVKEQYQVLIQAKDMGGQLGGLAGTTVVNITLSDVNDNPIRFPKSIFHLKVPESSPVGSAIGKIKALDPDFGQNAEIETIVPGDGGNLFDIVTDEDTQEGVIKLKKPLDFETKKAYTFKVEASNLHLDHRFHSAGPFKDTATVKISVLDVDEPPVFSKPLYTMEVYEDTPVRTFIGAVTAQDLDVGSSVVRCGGTIVVTGLGNDQTSGMWAIFRLQHPGQPQMDPGRVRGVFRTQTATEHREQEPVRLCLWVRFGFGLSQWRPDPRAGGGGKSLLPPVGKSLLCHDWLTHMAAAVPRQFTHPPALGSWAASPRPVGFTTLLLWFCLRHHSVPQSTEFPYHRSGGICHVVREKLYTAHCGGLPCIPCGADAHFPCGLFLDLHTGKRQALLGINNVLGAAVKLGAEAEAHEFEALHELPRTARGALFLDVRRLVTEGLRRRTTCVERDMGFLSSSSSSSSSSTLSRHFRPLAVGFKVVGGTVESAGPANSCRSSLFAESHRPLLLWPLRTLSAARAGDWGTVAWDKGVAVRSSSRSWGTSILDPFSKQEVSGRDVVIPVGFQCFNNGISIRYVPKHHALNDTVVLLFREIFLCDLGNPLLTSKVNILINVLDVNEFPPEISVPYETAVCENAKEYIKLLIIQIVSAADRDLLPAGQQFSFRLSPEAAIKPNFTVRDFRNNTAGIETRRNGYSCRQQELYFLPVVIEDSSYPVQSSTNTMTIHVCRCDSDGTILSCNVEAIFLPVGLSTGTLIAILLCIVILLAIVVLYIALHRQRKKDTLMTSKEDIRENVIHYDDEGGGEDDTQAFHIGALRNPTAVEENKIRRDIKPDSLCLPRQRPLVEDSTDIRDFIHQRLQEHDLDPAAPPYDSLATFAYEGAGSLATLLSSIDSLGTDADQDYNYLANWGPLFKVLADMFHEQESYNPDKVT